MESEIALLAGARKMNGDALIRIFDLYTPALYQYAFRLCRNAVMADQIVGAVFAKLFEHLSAGTGPSANLRLYLYEMAHHILVDEVRHSHETAPLEVDGLPYTGGNAEERLRLETVLRAILNDLTDDQRHVIILRFMEGFSVKETAAIIGKKWVT
jgi:RNA polymerase sigma-70 factor (ECF subfamily)